VGVFQLIKVAGNAEVPVWVDPKVDTHNLLACSEYQDVFAGMIEHIKVKSVRC
jgi:hypothetical protein